MKYMKSFLDLSLEYFYTFIQENLAFNIGPHFIAFIHLKI